MIPRPPGYFSVGSRRYNEWQTLAYEATTDRKEEFPEEETGPLVDHPSYPTPKKILTRPTKNVEEKSMETVKIASRSGDEGLNTCGGVNKITEEDEIEGEMPSRLAINMIKETQSATPKHDQVIDHDLAEANSDPMIIDRDSKFTDQDFRSVNLAENSTEVKAEGMLTQENEEGTLGNSIFYHESGELYAEDVDQHMAVLPEVVSSTAEITIDDIQVGDPGIPLTQDQEKLRQLIWKSRHLLIGKGNALPPAARGAVCDIDVGGARPIAQRVRPVAPKFREKLADLIKGLLSAKIIRPSTSPWASPIVVIIKKTGVDIRLCIDYRRVNQLTRLMYILCRLSASCYKTWIKRCDIVHWIWRVDSGWWK